MVKDVSARELVPLANLSETCREIEPAGEGPQPLCKCGRGPCRKNQRNCLDCNREANAKYRAELKRQQEAIKRALRDRY